MIAGPADDHRIDFEVADLRELVAGPVDVLVSNATLQWVPEHLDLLPPAGRPGRARRLARVPGARQLRRAQPHDPRPSSPRRRRTPRTPRGWPSRTATTRPIYLDTLAALGCTVDAWETTYLHVLTGPDPVFTWVSGTGARPTLQALPDDLRPGVRGGVQAPAGGGVPRARVRRGAAVPPGLRGGAGGGMRLHHVQVACPRRREGRGPALLRRRPRHDRGREAGGPGRTRGLGSAPAGAEIHVGVEEPFAPPARRTRRWSSTAWKSWPSRDAHGNRVEVLGSCASVVEVRGALPTSLEITPRISSKKSSEKHPHPGHTRGSGPVTVGGQCLG